MNSISDYSPPKPTIKVNFGDETNIVAGNLLLDSGASRSMIHVKMLEKAQFVVSPNNRRNGYVGAGSNKLILAPYLVCIRILIPNCGVFEFRDVLVNKGPVVNRTMLVGGPDMDRMGVILDYNSKTISFGKGTLKGKSLKMIQDHKNRVASMNAELQFLASIEEIERKIEHKNANRDKSIAIIDQALEQHLIENPIKEIPSYFNQINKVGNSALYWKMKSKEDKDGIQTEHNTENDYNSTLGICGDPCSLNLEDPPCKGCDRCTDKSKNIDIREACNLPKDSIHTSSKLALQKLIEKLREKQRTTFSHHKCTIGAEFQKRHPAVAEEVRKLIEEYKDVFAGDIGRVGDEYIVKGKMVGTTSPQRPGHQNFEGIIKDSVINQFTKLAASGVIVRCDDYGIIPENQLLVLPVRKKDDDGNLVEPMTGLRLVQDCREANGQTKFCGSKTNNINDALRFATRTSASGFNAKVDIANAYYTIPIDPSLWPFFCVDVPTLGTYCFVRLVQGWAPAAQVCQEVLTHIFYPIHEFLEKYMDDLIFATEPSSELYLHKLRQFFQICRSNGLRLKGEKCFFGVYEFNYLGCRISHGVMKASPHYVMRLDKVIYEELTTKTKVRSFIQSVAFIQKFLNHSTALLKPLRDATIGEKKDTFLWTPELIASFNKIRAALKELYDLHPFDPTLQTILIVDTSKIATGGFMYQTGPQGPRLITFFSRSRKEAERKIPLSSCYMELTGMKSMVLSLLPMLQQCDKPIIVVTDSRSVVKIFEKFRRFEVPSHDTVINNALYHILSAIDVQVIHANATNKNIKIADDLSRLGVMKNIVECEGKPKCGICQAADPFDIDKANILNFVEQMNSVDLNFGNNFNPIKWDDPTMSDDSAAFKTLTVFKIDENSEFSAERKMQLQQFLSQDRIIQQIQDRSPILRRLRQGLEAGRTSYPQKQQILQTLLETKRAKIEDGMIKIDKYTDGVLSRVIPIPESVSFVVISVVHNTVGHGSIAQMVKQVSKYFHFEKLRDKVKNFVDRCVKCTLHKGGQSQYKGQQKPVPIPDEFYKVILVDEVTRTFRNRTVKFFVAMEALSSFMTVIIYEKSMTGPKFIQLIAQIKSILCPHGLDFIKLTIRCDQASWHKSMPVKEALLLMNVETLFYNSTTLSKNIIPELDVRIKIYSQFLKQFVDNTIWDIETCCFVAAAKCNNNIGSHGYTPAELFVGRGWLDGQTIQIDAKELIHKIRTKREQRRETADRALANQHAKKELKTIPYKNKELNSPVVNNPQLLKLKSGDQVTLKGNTDKNDPKCAFVVHKVDFKKRLALLARNAGRETVVCDPKWISFELIDHIFKPEDLIFQNYVTTNTLEDPNERLIPAESLVKFLILADASLNQFKNSPQIKEDLFDCTKSTPIKEQPKLPVPQAIADSSWEIISETTNPNETPVSQPTNVTSTNKKSNKKRKQGKKKST